MYQIAYHKQQYDDNGNKCGLSPWPSFRNMTMYETTEEAVNSPLFKEQEQDGRKYFPRVWDADEVSGY